MLCTYGPPGERKRLWILKFEDADVADMHFDSEDEALETFRRKSDSWTCTLLSTHEIQAEARWFKVSLAGEEFVIDNVKHGEICRGIEGDWSAHYHSRRLGSFATPGEARSAVRAASHNR